MVYIMSWIDSPNKMISYAQFVPTRELAPENPPNDGWNVIRFDNQNQVTTTGSVTPPLASVQHLLNQLLIEHLIFIRFYHSYATTRILSECLSVCLSV
jgi:hypothetical protein